MEIVCRSRINCQKELWFGKSYYFTCLMGYFRGTWSDAIESSVPCCICLVRVAQTVLAWQISDLDSEAATRDVLSKKPATLLKMRFWHRCFPMNFACFLQNTSGWLLDSPKSVSLHCNELFFMALCWVLQCQWYFHVYYLLVYLQASNLNELEWKIKSKLIFGKRKASSF